MFFLKERKKQSIYRKADFIFSFCANVKLFIVDHFSNRCKAKLRTLTVHCTLCFVIIENKKTDDIFVVALNFRSVWMNRYMISE